MNSEVPRRAAAGARRPQAGERFRRADPAEPAARRRREGEDRGAARRLRDLNAELLTLPDGFSVHKKLCAAARSGRRCSRSRASAPSTGRPPRNWRTRRFSAKASASASRARTWSAAPSAIATPCCTTRTTGATFVPLQSIPQAKAAFEIHNSPLTELATIGFEFGYNVQEPSRLVIWEAQYGDFINGAQMILDEFLCRRAASGDSVPRWCCCCRTRTKAPGPNIRARGRNASCSSPPISTCGSSTARQPRSTSTCCGVRRRCCWSIRFRWSCSRRRACSAIRSWPRRRANSPKAASSA